jgi:hypothetical protein
VVQSRNDRSKWSAEDEAAISRTVHDYFEGWFEGDAGRMRRALHPALAKRGYEGGGDALEDGDTAPSMIDATARGVGTRYPPSRRHFEVEVVDVYRTIANVTVRSDVYREYLGLVRTPDGWKIANALWRFVDEVER